MSTHPSAIPHGLGTVIGRSHPPSARRDLTPSPSLVDRVLDRVVAIVPRISWYDVRRSLEHTADVVGDRLGMPGRDVSVLAASLSVVALLLGVGLFATADPEPGPMRQLEAQHQEWLREQSKQGPVASIAP